MLKVKALKRLKDFFLDVEFEVKKGSYTVILGESGAGKSLTLKIISGFVKPDSGKIVLGNRDVSTLPPEKRGVVYLPQSLGLFPHMSVRDNLVFPLKLHKNELKKDLLEKVVEEFGLKGLLGRYPSQLSSGEKQRVALARAILANPKVLLFDEPLSSLDFHIKVKLMEFLKTFKNTYDLTILHVTHDPLEASYLAEEVIVLSKGKVVFKGKPENLLTSGEVVNSSEVVRAFKRLSDLVNKGSLSF